VSRGEASSYQAQAAPPTLAPSPEAIAEVVGLRHADVQSIATRLGRLDAREYDRMFGGACTLFLGGLIGGAISMAPFLSTTPRPSSGSQLAYIVALAAAAVLALICGVARLAIRSQRTESVQTIQTDLKKMLEAYDLSKLAPASATASVENTRLLRDFLRKQYIDDADLRAARRRAAGQSEPPVAG
jgi:hypothetical protein